MKRGKIQRKLLLTAYNFLIIVLNTMVSDVENSKNHRIVFSHINFPVSNVIIMS